MNNLIIDEILKYSKDLEKRSPEYFKLTAKNKSHAHEFLKVSGLPSKDHEDWIYTQIQKNMAFRPFEHKSDTIFDRKTLKTFENTFELFFVNGVFHETLSHKDGSFSVSELNSSEEETSFDHFSALNTYLSLKHYVIKIHKNFDKDKSIHIVHLFDENSLNRIVSPKISIEVESFSETSIIESFQSSIRDLFQYTAVANTTLVAQNGAVVDYVRLNYNAKKSTYIGSSSIFVHKDATVNAFTFDSGILTARENLNITLKEENASGNHYGATLTKGSEHTDIFTKTFHLKPHTNSEQIVKNVIADEAHAVFTGRIVVALNSAPINSSQLNNNLLLSKKAHISTRPQLEVSADDVKCAHGATIGQLSEEEEFYLISRGLSRERSRALLCKGFIFEIIYKLKNKNIIHFLSTLFDEELKKTNA